MREQTPSAAEERRRLVREQAEHVNRCRDWDEQPVFEITQFGDVFCAHDGRPVTDPRQTLAERFYRMELAWGGPGLVHDEKEQAFYAPGGELTVSRERVDLRHLMGKERERRWASGIG
jgi:hypothetical protein